MWWCIAYKGGTAIGVQQQQQLREKVLGAISFSEYDQVLYIPYVPGLVCWLGQKLCSFRAPCIPSTSFINSKGGDLRLLTGVPSSHSFPSASLIIHISIFTFFPFLTFHVDLFSFHHLLVFYARRLCVFSLTCIFLIHDDSISRSTCYVIGLYIYILSFYTFLTRRLWISHTKQKRVFLFRASVASLMVSVEDSRWSRNMLLLEGEAYIYGWDWKGQEPSTFRGSQRLFYRWESGACSIHHYDI